MRFRIVVAVAAMMCMPAAVAAKEIGELQAGRYKLDKTHASLIWRVSHSGLSRYTARFTEFDALIDLDPDDPTRSSVRAIINPATVRTDHPTMAEEWEAELANDSKWFNSVRFPEIVFRSVSVKASPGFTNRGRIRGELSFLGVTKPVELTVTYNGSARLPWFGDSDVIGFSAYGTLRRADFGMTTMLPNVGDVVEIIIEAEFVHAGS